MKPEAWRDIPDRLSLVREMLRSCRLCPRECNVNRTAGEKGYCRLTDRIGCFREGLYYCEEQELIPSHHIYFSGCNLSCEFCVLPEWNEQPDSAFEMNAETLANVVKRRKSEGARTLNILGGEPTVNIHGILEFLARISPDTCVVWNSNMYFSQLVFEVLDGLVDIYLADFKCGNQECSRKILGIDNYVPIISQNLLKANKYARLMVRHLLLPGHRKCCMEPILRWLADEIPEAKVSLRGDYVPPALASSTPCGYLTSDEFTRARDFAKELKLNLVQ